MIGTFPHRDGRATPRLVDSGNDEHPARRESHGRSRQTLTAPRPRRDDLAAARRSLDETEPATPSPTLVPMTERSDASR